MATQSDRHSEVNCPICLEKLNLPKTLPCLHTFCEPCIQSYVHVRTSTGDEGDNTRFFKCPVCRRESDLSNLPVSKWIQELPTDHLVQLLNSYGDTNDDSKTSEVFCDPCLIANEKNIAKHHCRDCKECYCEQCLNYLHKRKRDSNLHAVMNITDDTQRKPLEVDERCLIHANKVLEVFCFKHKQLCCVICLVTDHKECDNVKTLDDIAKDDYEIIDMEEFMSNITNVEQCTKATIEKSKENLAELKGDKESMLQCAAEIISKTKSHLDTLHEELKGSIEKTFSNTEQRQEFDIDCIVDFQKCLPHNRMLAEAVKEHGSKKQKFLTLEKIKTLIQKDFERLHLAFNYTGTGKQYVLDIENELEDVQKLSKLATVTLNPRQSDETALTNITETLCQLGCIPECTVFVYSLPTSNVAFPQYSPPFSFLKGQTKWRLVYTKKEEMLGIFLRCLPNDHSGWSQEVSAEFCVVNQMKKGKDHIKTFTQRFHKNGSSRGYSSFLDWESLVSNEKGYISDGMVKIKVKVW